MSTFFLPVTTDYKWFIFINDYQKSLVYFACRILEDRISRLHTQFQRLQQFADQGHDMSLDTTYLSVLYEDLHWIILVSSKCD